MDNEVLGIDGLGVDVLGELVVGMLDVLAQESAEAAIPGGLVFDPRHFIGKFVPPRWWHVF